MRRELLNSKNSFDAGVLGYDGPVDPAEDGEGLIVSATPASFATIPMVSLVGPDGVVELVGRSQIEAVIQALTWALDPVAAARARAAA